MGKRGRPLEGEEKRVKLQTHVFPALKKEAEMTARHDGRIRSLSNLLESAIAYYLRDYKTMKVSGGDLDNNNFPKLEDSELFPLPEAIPPAD